MSYCPQTLERWTKVEAYNPSPEYRASFIKYASLGMVSGDVHDPASGTGAFKAFYWLSGNFRHLDTFHQSLS
jgi:hypothetical protein